MTPITLTLPLRLVSEANAHEHWRKRQERAKRQRGLAKMVTLGSFGGRNIRLPLVVTLTRIAPRQFDSDNAVGACKHVRDGVADALDIDDRDPRVTWRYAQRRAQDGDDTIRYVSRAGGTGSRYGVEIRIESASECAA